MQRQIGEDLSLLIRFSLPDDGGFVSKGGVQVPIQAVIGHIGVTAFEPFVENASLPDIKIIIKNFFRRLEPGQLTGCFAPETFGVVDRTVIEFLILIDALDPCFFRKCFIRIKFAVIFINTHLYQSPFKAYDLFQVIF